MRYLLLLVATPTAARIGGSLTSFLDGLSTAPAVSPTAKPLARGNRAALGLHCTDLQVFRFCAANTNITAPKPSPCNHLLQDRQLDICQVSALDLRVSELYERYERVYQCFRCVHRIAAEGGGQRMQRRHWYTSEHHSMLHRRRCQGGRLLYQQPVRTRGRLPKMHV